MGDEIFPPMWAMADAPLQNAGPTQVQGQVAPGGIPISITPEATEYADAMSPGLQAQMPTDGTFGGGQLAADLSGPADALANNQLNQPDEAMFGGLGLMGVLGIANMAAGMGRQVYEALKPKPKPKIALRPMGGNPYGG